MLHSNLCVAYSMLLVYIYMKIERYVHSGRSEWSMCMLHSSTQFWFFSLLVPIFRKRGNVTCLSFTPHENIVHRLRGNACVHSSRHPWPLKWPNLFNAILRHQPPFWTLPLYESLSQAHIGSSVAMYLLHSNLHYLFQFMVLIFRMESVQPVYVPPGMRTLFKLLLRICC